MLIPVVFFKEIIIRMTFSEEYLKSGEILLLVSIGQIGIAIHHIYASIFQGINKPQISAITTIVAALISSILGYFLIKSHGLYGAGISYAIVGISVMILTSSIFHLKWQSKLMKD